MHSPCHQQQQPCSKKPCMSQISQRAVQGSSLIRHPLQGPVEAPSLVRLLTEALELLTTALWLLHVMTNLCWEETEAWEKKSGYRDVHRGGGRSVGGAGLAPACPCIQQLSVHLLWTRSSLALSGLLHPGILAGFLSFVMSCQCFISMVIVIVMENAQLRCLCSAHHTVLHIMLLVGIALVCTVCLGCKCNSPTCTLASSCRQSTVHSSS